MSSLSGKRSRHRRLAWDGPRQRAGPRQNGRAGSGPLQQRRERGRSRRRRDPQGRRTCDAIAADLSAPDGAHKLARQVRAVVGDRLDILVANAGISKAATIEEPRSRISTGSSQSTSAHRSFLSSSSFRSCRREAASFSSRRWRHVPPSVQFRRMQQPRAPSTPW